MSRDVRHVVMVVQNLSVPQDRRVWREALTLRGAGFGVSVVCPRGRGEPSHEELNGVAIHRFPAAPALPGMAGLALETAWTLAFTVMRCVALRLRGRMDVLHAANPPDTFFLVASLFRPLGLRFVYDQHDLCPELLAVRAGDESLRRPAGRLIQWLERCSYRTAELVVLPNNSYRRIALSRGRVDPAAAVVVRSGADEVIPRPERPRNKPMIVAFAGVMGAQDRVDVLLDAAASVLRERPDSLSLDLIGTGDAVPALRCHAAELGIEDRTRWAGWLRGSELAARLQRADVAVSLDDDDVFSRQSTMTKIPEYLALGLPCIVSDLPENRVTAGAAAWYFDPGNVGALAEKLIEFIDHPDAAQDLARRAHEQAPAVLWAASAERMIQAYHWLLEGGPVVEGDQLVPSSSGQPTFEMDSAP